MKLAAARNGWRGFAGSGMYQVQKQRKEQHAQDLLAHVFGGRRGGRHGDDGGGGYVGSCTKRKLSLDTNGKV